MTRQESYIRAVKTFNRWLEHKRLRKTPERFAILKMAWQLHGHFGVDALRSGLEKIGYHVSRATVYNTVSLLEDCGVLRRHQFGSEATYETAMRDEDAAAETASLLAPCRYEGFAPAYLSAYIYGVCSGCAARLRAGDADTTN